MNAPLRLIDTGLSDARRNIAVTAALAERHAGGHAPDTLRLYRFPRAVLLGAGQRLDEAVDVAACRAAGIAIARRVTGGGAVYMGPGVLTFDLVAERRRLGGELAAIGARVGAGLAAGLARLGIAARFAPPNSITVDERKISGASGLLDGDTAVLQGTVLVDADLTEMAAALAAPAGKGIAAQVTTLAIALGRVPPADAVKAALLDGLAAALGRGFIAAEIEPAEVTLAERLLAEGIGGTAPDVAPDLGAITARALVPPIGAFTP